MTTFGIFAYNLGALDVEYVQSVTSKADTKHKGKERNQPRGSLVPVPDTVLLQNLALKVAPLACIVISVALPIMQPLTPVRNHYAVMH